MAENKHKGSSFDDYLLESLRESNELVVLFLQDALTELDTSDNEYTYLLRAISAVAKARGKDDLLQKNSITKQKLEQILVNGFTPSIQNVKAILNEIEVTLPDINIEKIQSIDNTIR